MTSVSIRIDPEEEVEPNIHSDVSEDHHSLDVVPHDCLKLRQPGFCTEKIFVYTGNEQMFTWDEAGISLHFRAASCTTNIQVSVGLVTVVDETHILPEGKALISAMYNITASHILPAPVGLRIHHCVRLVPYDEPFSKSITFIIANDGPPYHFKPLPGGTFGYNLPYGEIEVSEFSLLSILWDLLGWRMSLSVHVFYHGDSTATFVVTKNIPPHINAVKDEYSNALGDPDTRSMMCNYSTEKIALTMPPSSGGWTVKPVFSPAEIDMHNILDFGPGKTSPCIKLTMNWEGEGEPRNEQVEIKVTGGNLESFILFCRPPSNVSVQTPPPLRTGHVDIDNNLLTIKRVLKGLSKEEIRNLGLCLGLSYATVDNYATSSVNKYLEEIVKAWIQEKDEVLNKFEGGAKWENLRKALEEEGLTGFARKI